VKDIVLQVKGFFRLVDQDGPGGKGIQAGGQEVESRRPRVVDCPGLNLLPQTGPFGPVQGAGDGARVIIRDAGAPVQEKKEQQAQREEGGSARRVTRHRHFLLSLRLSLPQQR